jgi:hypothetical protein
MGHRAGGHGLGKPCEGAPGPGPEPLEEGAAEGRHLDPLQQAVADPVGLHHLGIQGVVAAVGPRDQLQVGPGAVESAGELGQAAVGHSGRGLLELGAAVIRPAVAERVGRVA